jgi:hypothetical protein
VAAEAVEESLEDHFARLDRELASMLQEMRSAVEAVRKLNSIRERTQPLIAWRREQMAELHVLMERRGALLSGGSGQGFPSYVVARNGGGNVLAEVARLDETIAAKLAENRAVLDALELILQENCGLVGSCRELRDHVARCAQTALRTVGHLGEISEALDRSRAPGGKGKARAMVQGPPRRLPLPSSVASSTGICSVSAARTRSRDAVLPLPALAAASRRRARRDALVRIRARARETTVLPSTWISHTPCDTETSRTTDFAKFFGALVTSRTPVLCLRRACSCSMMMMSQRRPVHQRSWEIALALTIRDSSCHHVWRQSAPFGRELRRSGARCQRGKSPASEVSVVQDGNAAPSDFRCR